MHGKIAARWLLCFEQRVSAFSGTWKRNQIYFPRALPNDAGKARGTLTDSVDRLCDRSDDDAYGSYTEENVLPPPSSSTHSLQSLLFPLNHIYIITIYQLEISRNVQQSHPNCFPTSSAGVGVLLFLLFTRCASRRNMFCSGLR